MKTPLTFDEWLKTAKSISLYDAWLAGAENHPIIALLKQDRSPARVELMGCWIHWESVMKHWMTRMIRRNKVIDLHESDDADKAIQAAIDETNRK